MKHTNFFKNIFNKITSFFSKKTLLPESTTIEQKTKTEESELSIHELEEIQYELENGYIEENDLTEDVKKQLLKLYDNQIQELQTDVNILIYELSKKHV